MFLTIRPQYMCCRGGGGGGGGVPGHYWEKSEMVVRSDYNDGFCVML